jgi:hypothetical protein
MKCLAESHDIDSRERRRRLVCQLAVRHLGHSEAAVARFLGVTTPGVNRAAWTEPLPDLAELP